MSDINILLHGDVVVTKCPRSELLLEGTTVRHVSQGGCMERYALVIGRTSYVSRDQFLGVHYTLEQEWVVSRVANPRNY